MITDHTNKRFCLILGLIARILVSWHTEDNRRTRDSESTWAWNMEQVDGGYMKHVCQFFGLMFDVRSLEESGFAMDDSDIANLQDDITAEDAFAQYYGTGVFSMGGHRVRRNLPRPAMCL